MLSFVTSAVCRYVFLAEAIPIWQLLPNECNSLNQLHQRVNTCCKGISCCREMFLKDFWIMLLVGLLFHGTTVHVGWSKILTFALCELVLCIAAACFLNYNRSQATAQITLIEKLEADKQREFVKQQTLALNSSSCPCASNHSTTPPNQLGLTLISMPLLENNSSGAAGKTLRKYTITHQSIVVLAFGCSLCPQLNTLEQAESFLKFVLERYDRDEESRQSFHDQYFFDSKQFYRDWLKLTALSDSSSRGLFSWVSQTKSQKTD